MLFFLVKSQFKYYKLKIHDHNNLSLDEPINLNYESISTHSSGEHHY